MQTSATEVLQARKLAMNPALRALLISGISAGVGGLTASEALHRAHDLQDRIVPSEHGIESRLPEALKADENGDKIPDLLQSQHDPVGPRLSINETRQNLINNMPAEHRELYEQHSMDPTHPVNQVLGSLALHRSSPDLDLASLDRSKITHTADDIAWQPGREGQGVGQKDLENLGFMKSMVAVPEAGQESLATHRHPQSLVHFHDHGKNWMFHEDRLPSIQMEAARAGQDPNSTDTYRDAIAAGTPHALAEGVPGYMRYIGGRVMGMPTLDSLASGVTEDNTLRMAGGGAVAGLGAGYLAHKALPAATLPRDRR